MSEDHTRFLKYINHEWKTPAPASGSTILLQLLDVNTTRFKAHSTHSTASIKAFLEGIDIRALKHHANGDQR
jgi:hypothetical protein